jgi:hypothetical protein
VNDAQIEYEEVENLLLDPENPRLPEELQGGEQDQILAHIARHESVEDLMAAIGRNGFFNGEPLIVYRDPKKRNKWRVIEGNRRLASVFLLNDPSRYPGRPSLADIAAETPQRNKPKKLPVVRVDNRADALPYLGSRHIVGVKSWDPLPKARYIYQLFRATPSSKSPRDRYKDVARRIGSGKRSDYIRKNLNALAVFDVIKDQDFFGDKEESELTFSFGVLYTALDWRSIAGFVGIIDYDSEEDVALKDHFPIINRGVLKRPRIKELYNWCFHKDPRTGTTVLGESRSLYKLAEVLRSPEALSELRQTNSLDLAYERSEGISNQLSEALLRALNELRYANGAVANARPAGLVEELANKVFEQAETLRDAIARRSTASRRTTRGASA